MEIKEENKDKIKRKEKDMAKDWNQKVMRNKNC